MILREDDEPDGLAMDSFKTLNSLKESDLGHNERRQQREAKVFQIQR
jgi:hypothetical protein